MTESHDSYITVTSGMAGWFAVLMWWNPEEHFSNGDGFWEPWETGFGRYGTKEEAIAEAKAWAESEEMEYRE